MIQLKEDGSLLLCSSQSNAGWPYCFAASGCQVPLQAPCCPRRFYRDAGLAGLSRFSAANSAASSPSCVFAFFETRADAQLHAMILAPLCSPVAPTCIVC